MLLKHNKILTINLDIIVDYFFFYEKEEEIKTLKNKI